MAFTYQDALEHRIGELAGQSIGGSPWDDETESAVQRLLDMTNITIQADPVLSEIFVKRAKPEHLSGTSLTQGPDGLPVGYVSDDLPF